MDLLSEIQLGLTLASALTEHHAKAQHALDTAADALNQAEKVAGDSAHSDDSKRAALSLLRGAAVEAMDRYRSSLDAASDAANRLRAHATGASGGRA